MDEKAYITLDCEAVIPAVPVIEAEVATPYVVLGDSEIAELQARITELSSQLSTAQAEVTTLTTAVTTLQGQLTTANEDRAALVEQVSALNTQLSAAQAQVSSLQAELSSLQAELTAKQEQVSLLQSSVDTLTAANTQLESDKATLIEQWRASQAQVSDLTSQVSSLTSQASSLQQQLTLAQQANTDLSAQLDTLLGVTLSEPSGSKANRAIAYKADIKAAIEAKGVSVGTAPLEGYAAKVAAIVTGGGVSYPIADPMAWMQGVLDNYKAQRASTFGHVILFVFNDYLDEFQSNTYFNYSAANVLWTFSDGTTLSATSRYKFTHTWDKSKDIEFSADENVRWAICDCSSEVMAFTVETLYKATSVIGCIFDAISFSSQAPTADLYALRWIKYINGSVYTVAPTYGGYLNNSNPRIIDGIDWSTVNNNYFQLSYTTVELRNIHNIGYKIEIGSAGKCALSKASLDAIYAGCSQQSTTVQIVIGSNNYNRFTSEQIAQLTEWGYTLA